MYRPPATPLACRERFAHSLSPTIIAADIISTVEFDSTGNYLATGDKGGRVVLFERNEMVRVFLTIVICPIPTAQVLPQSCHHRSCWLTFSVFSHPSRQKKGCEYKFYTEFQSHEPEFDYLKSLEIEEKINKIKWCKRQNAAHFLLSTNGEFIVPEMFSDI